MPWRRLCSARLCRMNGKFFHARSIRPRAFACSATFGAAPYSTGEHKPHIQTSRKTAKISRESYNTLIVNIGTDAELLNIGYLIANGGSVFINASTAAIAGGFGPVRGVAAIAACGTLE